MQDEKVLTVPESVKVRIRRERRTVIGKTIFFMILLCVCEYFYLFEYFETRIGRFTKPWMSIYIFADSARNIKHGDSYKTPGYESFPLILSSAV